MFQLVVALISICIIAFAALSSLYFGADAFAEGSRRARLAAEGQQVSPGIQRDLPMVGSWTTGSSIR